jgi:hypothetical protein
MAPQSLPAAAGRVRALVGPAIAPAQRAGRLRLIELKLQAVSGAPVARAEFVGDDRQGRTVSVQIALAYQRGRWQVVTLIAPDLTTALRSRTVRAPSAGPFDRAVASRFTVAYVNWVEGVTHRRPSASAAVARQLAAGQDPLSSLTPSHRRARVLRVELGPLGSGSVDAVVQFQAGGGPRTFAFALTGAGAHWQVSQLIPDSLGTRL